MVNSKQLKILKKDGIKAWNRLVEESYSIEINLSKANLDNADLSKAKLKEGNLSESELVLAKLKEADLTMANLSHADLTKADLFRANLNKANLTEATLTQTDFYQADLSYARLNNTKLMNADLSEANLTRAKLNKSILSEADLSEANLTLANFSYADLTNVNLSTVRALATKFNNAILTGACIEDWNINSKTNFENVICDYIYLKKGKQERRPSDPNRNFKPGEFAKLVEQSIYTVDLVFNNGIDWEAFSSSLQDSQVEYDEQNVFIQAIERKNDGACVIRLSVPLDANKAEIESKVMQSYDTKLRVLEADNHRLLQHNASLENIVNTLASRPIIVEAKAVAESKSMSDTFNNDLKGANIANYANKVEGNARQQANQNIYASEQKQTLAQAAEEIQKLLKQLEQDNPNPTEDQQIEHLNDETTPKFKRKVVAALKAAGDTAIDEFLENSYVKVGKAAIMGWVES